ncbi:MAG: DNA alkylation repair protein [Saprospiraceae bacterium]
MIPAELLKNLKSGLKALGDPDRALSMQAYMKDQFTYFGVSSPVRKKLQLELFPQRGDVTLSYYQQFFQLAWQEEEREMKYVALDFARKFLLKKETSLIKFFEPFITDQSWWDTVDALVPNLIGPLVIGDSSAAKSLMHRWIQQDNFWLQRSAFILQLTYRDQTNFSLLKELILYRQHSREFFVRKAAGWALRQYAKFAPEEVLLFIEENPQLSGLTRREAIRNLI